MAAKFHVDDAVSISPHYYPVEGFEMLRHRELTPEQNMQLENCVSDGQGKFYTTVSIRKHS